MNEPLSYLFPMTTTGTYQAFSSERVRDAMLHPRARPQVDLKVVWSCAQCGHEFSSEVVERRQGYYEIELWDEWACPVCDAAYYLEKNR